MYKKEGLNLIISIGDFPENLKQAVIVTLYKSRSKTANDNYRPIALLSQFSKKRENCNSQSSEITDSNNFFSVVDNMV